MRCSSYNDSQLKPQQGYTFIEILLVISIMSVILLTSIPNLNTLLTRTEQEIALDRIKNAIELAKSEAFRKNKTISLCPTSNQNTCTYGDTWEVGFMMFENPERDTQPAAGAILQLFPGAKYGKIIYDAMGNQLNIHPDGTTTNIGNFVYCAKNKGSIKPKGLVLNWVARLYPAEENPTKSIDGKCGYGF